MRDEGRSSPHRVAIVDAAVRVLAEASVPGLTPAAVDHASGLPEGTTAAEFASTRELLDGVTDRLVEMDGALWTELGGLTPDSVADLADRMAGWVELALTREPVAMRARMHFFLGAGELAAHGHYAILDVAIVLLDVLGIPEPARRTRLMMDLVAGTLLHHVSVRSDEPFVRAEFAAAVRGVLAGR